MTLLHNTVKVSKHTEPVLVLTISVTNLFLLCISSSWMQWFVFLTLQLAHICVLTSTLSGPLPPSLTVAEGSNLFGLAGATLLCITGARTVLVLVIVGSGLIKALYVTVMELNTIQCLFYSLSTYRSLDGPTFCHIHMMYPFIMLH